MILRKFFIIFFASFFVSSAFAGYSSFSCPNTFKQITMGDSTASVQTACGVPTTNMTKQVQVSTPFTVTDWIYTLGLLSIKGVILNLPSLTITFQDHQVVSIAKEGLPIHAGGYCSVNGIINIGDPDTTVIATCGQPNFVNTREQQKVSTKDVVEWIYNYGPYKPQIILDFENDALTQIISGQLGK